MYWEAETAVVERMTMHCIWVGHMAICGCMACRAAGRHEDALAAYDRAIAVGREAADPAMHEADLQARHPACFCAC